jgi:hypothetical protein
VGNSIDCLRRPKHTHFYIFPIPPPQKKKKKIAFDPAMYFFPPTRVLILTCCDRAVSPTPQTQTNPTSDTPKLCKRKTNWVQQTYCIVNKRLFFTRSPAHLHHTTGLPISNVI